MFKKILLSLAFVAVLFNPIYGQDSKFVVPAQKVLGAEEAIPAGEMVVLKVSEITEKPKYLQDVSYSWIIIADGKEKKNVFTYPDNTTVGFGRGKAKKIEAILVVNYLYAVHDKDDKAAPIIEVAQKNSGIIYTPIKFEGSEPTPDPDVPVPPEPTPDIPVGKFNLGKSAYQLAYDKVSAGNRVVGAKAIATSTEGIAAAIRAGAIKDPEDALKKLTASNNSALRDAKINISEWDGWGTGLQDKLLTLYKASKLNTVSDYADAFDEIAVGLNKVK